MSRRRRSGLAQIVVGFTGHRSVFYGGVLTQHVLDLVGADLVPAALDEVRRAAADDGAWRKPNTSPAQPKANVSPPIKSRKRPGIRLWPTRCGTAASA